MFSKALTVRLTHVEVCATQGLPLSRRADRVRRCCRPASEELLRPRVYSAMAAAAQSPHAGPCAHWLLLVPLHVMGVNGWSCCSISQVLQGGMCLMIVLVCASASCNAMQTVQPQARLV